LREIIEEELESGSDSYTVSTLTVERNDGFRCNLIDHSDIGQSRIHRRSVNESAAADGRIDGELNQRHELIERFLLGRASGKTARKVQSAELKRKSPLYHHGIVQVSVVGLISSRLEEQSLCSSVDRKLGGDRTRYRERAQPL
jgi:hypothetical protein